MRTWLLCIAFSSLAAANTTGLYVLEHYKTHPCLGFGFANGIQTSLYRAQNIGSLISEWTGGYNVDLQYDEYKGFFSDLWQASEAFSRKHLLGAMPILEAWDRFFLNKPEGWYLEVCHSKGAINVRNGLEVYDHSRRTHISVLAIAPAAYIDRKLCDNVLHIFSENDLYARNLFSLFSENGPFNDKDHPAVVWIPAHPEASAIDHDADSPTYASKSEEFIRRFIDDDRYR